MWIALYLVVGLVGLVALMAAIGLALPRDHVAARRVTLARPPGEVWRALVDLEAQVTWRCGLKRIERLSDARFREHGSHGAITFEVVEEREPELRVTRIADDTLPFGGRWIYELEADGSNTRLAITESGFVKNPVFRLLSKTVFSPASTMERFLDDLARHLGVPAEVEPAEPSMRSG
jgi:hypothetical protein